MTITPTDEQNAARRKIVSWYKDKRGPQEFYLAGYAGTGKSTLLDLLIEELRQSCGAQRVRVGAYTGKAAHVLRRKGVEGAQTIHSMMYRLRDDMPGGELVWDLDPAGQAADADLIVLDECSMVPEAMAADLRSFGKKTLVLGDPGQLPPVRGAGAFTNREPDAFLSEIHRQAAENPIIRLATEVRQGRRPAFGDYGQGVKVVPYDQDAAQYVYDREIQVLCGLNRNRWGLTQRIRKHREYEGRLPQPGERILCCRNNRRTGLFNGMLGTVAAPMEPSDDQPECLAFVADMEDLGGDLATEVHPYLFEAHFTGSARAPELPKGTHVDHFDWGFVLTCHKAQGSQWPRISVVDDSSAFREDANRWLYTAITRAESELTLMRRAA